MQGDMQYHDGTEWVLVKSPTDPSVVNTLSFVNGTPTWAPTYYEVGDRGPAGGFVFSVNAVGLNGYEVAPSQSSDAPWGCVGTHVADAGGFDVGTGSDNTDAILAKDCLAPAATVARDFVLNGYTDWFLPSLDELTLLADVQVAVLQLALENDYFWSSTTTNNVGSAYSVRLSRSNASLAGTEDIADKVDTLKVVVIRAF
jgi:hypothetical protein